MGLFGGNPFKKLRKAVSSPFRDIARGDAVGAGAGLLNLGTFGVSGAALSALDDVTAGPSFPDVPSAQPPPPPAANRPRPPNRATVGDEAEADTRLLFRRRGRRSTVLTPGRGAGATTGERLGTTGRR